MQHKDKLAERISKPQEDAGLQVPREFLFGTISRMEEAVKSCSHDLVFNLDEVGAGVSEWEDRKSKKVIVPTAWVVRRFIMELTGIWNTLES
jgi:hypothetical protein